MRIILCFLLFFCLFSSCERGGENKQFTISGKLIDSTNKRNLEGYKLNVRSILGTEEKFLAEGLIDSNGKFKITYYFKLDNFGNNLRINIIPSILTQEKFEFLPLGENWYKEFYIGDSSTMFIKISKIINQNDTLFVYTPNKNYEFYGPMSNKNIGKIRMPNTRSEIYYRTNNSKINIFRTIPTGDPIVDTITLDINP